jgi:type III pantothenate kinase
MDTKILLLDIGNSRSKWTIINPYLDEDFHAHFGAINNAELASNEVSLQLTNLSKYQPELKHIIICNVADQYVENLWRQFLTRHFPNTLIQAFLSELSHPQIHNNYHESKDLGNDRWAAILGGLHFAHKGNYMVVNCGTAMTIDYVDEGLIFQGGWIIPGMNLMLHSLGSKTALLPNLSHQDPYPMKYGELGNSTQDAILQGVLHAQIGAIEIALKKHPQLAQLILSGGNSAVIGQYLPPSHLQHYEIIQDPYIVLRGLREWHRQLHPA